MIRGLYTGAAGMAVQQERLDALSNNLANVDTTGYKRDIAVQKSFPTMLLRRMGDDGVRRIPFATDPIGSIDTAPVVGQLGTGVETNEYFTVFEDGSLQVTNAPFDLALRGEGFFVVDTPYGERLTRNGGFMLGPEGLLVNKDGYPLLGEDGPIRVQLNNVQIDQDGVITQNPRYADDPDRLVSERENNWEESEVVDRIRLANVREPRYLRKQGSSLWNATRDSGEIADLQTGDRPIVRQGFLETSNVNPVEEMVRMIEVNRAYEANQKVIQTQDASTGRLINDVMRA